jgi:hypothetical protein
MSEQDPKHWLKPASPIDARLARLLEAGRAERPSEAQLQALAQRLGPTLGGPGPSGGGGTIPAPSAPWFVLAIAAAAVVALCGLWALRSGWADHADAPFATRTAAPKPMALDPRPQVAPLHRAPIRRDAGVPEAQEPRYARPQASSRVTVRDSHDQLALLEQAHRALAEAPKRALTATDLHAKRFPHSQYAQERELLAIDALTRLNDRSRARIRAERFLAVYPASSHVRRVRELLAWAATSSDTDAGAR